MEIGDWRLEIGDWRLEVGGWRLEVGGWRLEVGGWRLEGGGRGRKYSHQKHLQCTLAGTYSVFNSYINLMWRKKKKKEETIEGRNGSTLTPLHRYPQVLEGFERGEEGGS